MLLNPKKVLEEVDIEKEAVVADFGCGSGGWVIPLAKKEKGVRIYALDVLKEALSALRGNAEIERVYNIKTVHCDVERGTELQPESLDLVIMSNLLFQVDDRDAVIEEGRRVLRIKGKLLVVDWLVKENHSQEKLDEKIKEMGFNFIKKIDAGKQYFALLYEKK